MKNISQYEKLEKICSQLAESENDFSKEDFKFFDKLFEKNKSKIENFIEKSAKINKNSRIPGIKNILSGELYLVDSTRGDSINVSTYLYDTFEKKLGKICENNKAKIATFIKKYIVDHIAEMSTRGPGKRIIWSITDEENYFLASGVNRNTIADIIKGSDYIDPKWLVATKPLNMLMALQIVFYWRHMTKEEKSKTTEYKKTMVFLINLIFTIRFYTSLNLQYFQFEPDEELMNQTIEELSDRYTIKDMHNIYELLEYFAYTNIENAINLMERPTDYNINYLMGNLHGRINTTLKGIANAFYEKYNRGDSVQVDKMQGQTEEGDTYMNIPTSVSADIENITRKLGIRLVSDTSVDQNILKIACKETKISVAKMNITFSNMIGNDRDYVLILVRRILIYYLGYLKKDRKTIRSINFITLMKRTYNVSNTKDQGLIDIKAALEELMKRNNKEYLKINRVATLSNMKACCFYYWLLYINSRCE